MKMSCIILLLPLFVLTTNMNAKANSCNDDNYLRDVKGTVQRLSSNNDWYVIVPDDDDTQRFFPSNLPEEFRKNGLRVLFSGKRGEIPANVRMVGTPLELTKIEKLD